MKKMRWILWVLVLALLLPVSAKAAPMDLPAKSAVLMEVSTGKVLYEQNAHQPLPPASVTKVMTMLLVMEAIDCGQLGWDDMVTASEEAAAKGGSQVYLKAGEQMSVRDMLKAVAVSSANDCACALAEHISGSESAFVGQMNHRAQQLGMEHTKFVNCTGLDDAPEAAEHLTCAWDIAVMSRELLGKHPKIKEFTTIWMDTLRGGTFGLSNTNKLVRFYPGATGLKTGFTSQAGYCLSASAQRDGMELVAVVMGCATSKERFAACKSLLDRGFAGYAVVQPQLPEEMLVTVKLGKKAVVAAAGEKAPILVDKGQKNQVVTRYTLEESVSAPVSRGQRLGTATVQVGDQVIAQIPLLAQETVEKLGYWDIWKQVVRTMMMRSGG